jgi:molybdopterin-guanine dinucleotide biosynthesis protein
MTVIVIGGHARNTGKTTVVSGLIRAFPHCQWTAIKISYHWHADSPIRQRCDIREEKDRTGRSDTSRYLSAGAARSLWVRVQEDHFESAVQQLRPIIQSSPCVIIESNRILKYITPDLFIFVMRRDVAEFKKSAWETIDKAHAILMTDCGSSPPAGKDIAQIIPENIPIYASTGSRIIPAPLLDFIQSRLFPTENRNS